MKLILPAALALVLGVPVAASASVVHLGLAAPHEALLIKVGGKGHEKGHKGGRHGYDDRDERRAYREGYREGRRDARGDYRSGGDYGRRYGRGEYLPREYRGYVLNDYDDFGYPPPPRGCRYVQVGQDTYLTQIATGLILNAFLGGRY